MAISFFPQNRIQKFFAYWIPHQKSHSIGSKKVGLRSSSSSSGLIFFNMIDHYWHQYWHCYHPFYLTSLLSSSFTLFTLLSHFIVPSHSYYQTKSSTYVTQLSSLQLCSHAHQSSLLDNLSQTTINFAYFIISTLFTSIS